MTSMTGQPLPQVPQSPRALQSVEPVNCLPRPLTSFVGREREIAEIWALLERDDVRLLTLTGPGGVGKTRLSLRVAMQPGEKFNVGVVFVPLGSILDPSLVPAIVAQELGVPDRQNQSLSQRIRAHLKGRSLLLVLDNLEHLPGAIPFVADLLAHSDDLKILCTCRTRLGISGEQVFPVSSLGASAATALFEQRARHRSRFHAHTSADSSRERDL